ncbi:MAG: hypothetical protein J5586_05030 [Clostridia bacterium]|nr:hypothetical protein [Clostridia bacterium]
MANIERRRTRRKLNAVIAAAASVALIAGIAALIVFVKPKNKQANADASPFPTAAPAETPVVTSVPVSEEPITEAPAAETAAATDPVTAEPTAEPETTPDGAPVRILDEMSLVILTASVSTSYNAQGEPRARISGSYAIQFVNNTDSEFYALELNMGGTHIVSAAINGMTSHFTAEDGVLTVPFFNELKTGEFCEIVLMFTSSAGSGKPLELPSFTYDTSYRLNAFISSDVSFTFSGVRAKVRSEGGSYRYEVLDATVRSASAEPNY